MKKIAFIGDSVFDNKAFVGNGECHLDCAKRLLQTEYEPILLALDGSITLDTIKQLENIPEDTEIIVVSTGGNDAIHSLNSFLPENDKEIEEYKEVVIKNKRKLPNGRVGGVSNMMFMNLVNRMSPQIYALSKTQESFREDYSDLCERLYSMEKPVIVCTIYDSIPVLSPVLKTILSLFNDVIISVASDYNFDVLDLRKICTEDRMYSQISPIEPSSEGSEIINEKIVEAISNISKSNQNTKIFPKKV